MLTRLIRDERGVALVMVVGILAVLSVAVTGMIYFTSTNQRTSSHSKAEVAAIGFAEAGINNAYAVLFDIRNVESLVEPDFLSQARTTTYPGGSVTWSGTLFNINSPDPTKPVYWLITATGEVRNPTGPGAAPVRRTITARVPLKEPGLTTTGLDIWNWIYSHRTGTPGGCDMSILQSVNLTSPLYVRGNLCLRNGAKVARGPLIVGGSLDQQNPQTSVGTSTSPLTTIVKIGNGCRWSNSGDVTTWTIPCKAETTSPSTKVYVADSMLNLPDRTVPSDWLEYRYKAYWSDADALHWERVLREEGVITGDTELTHEALAAAFNAWVAEQRAFVDENNRIYEFALMSLPQIWWAEGYAPDGDKGWYEYASPGPYHPCTSATGTPPVFDTTTFTGAPDGFFNVLGGSVPGVFNLTPPGGSYSCTTRAGKLVWDAAARKLTIAGTIFIDGSATVNNNGAPILYEGQGVIYLTGTLTIKNTKLCAVVQGSSCNFTGWQPNSTLLGFFTFWKGGQISDTTVGIQVVSSEFQGALYAEWAIDASTTTKTQGPMVSRTEVRVGQTNENQFPHIDIVPIGMGATGPQYYTALDPSLG